MDSKPISNRFHGVVVGTNLGFIAPGFACAQPRLRGLKFYLEDLFHAKVDLVTKDAVKPRMRPIIEKDMIHVA